MSLLRAFSFALTILSIVGHSYGQNDYCRICKDHTMCIYTNTNPVCNAKVFGLTAAQRTEIVNEHNNYRQKVASGNEKRGSPGPQPAAKSMPNLEWDDELATIAQRWANQCKFGHDACRNTRRFGVGQNVAGGWAQGTKPASIRDMIKSWYEEVTKFNRDEVNKYIFRMETGHYTQMVWATTTKIGCGYVNYMNGNQDTVYLVCDYGPPGNFIGAKIYETR